MVMMADDPEHPDLFLLTDSEKGELLARWGSEVLQTLLSPDPGSAVSPTGRCWRNCVF